MLGVRRIALTSAVAVGTTLAVGGSVLALQGEPTSSPSASSPSSSASTAIAPSTAAPDTTTTVAATEHQHGHEPTIHDATGGGEPTEADDAGAQEFLDAVRTGTARFADVDVAIAEGYAISERGMAKPGRRKHYRLRGGNPAVLDPTQPEGLVYWSDGTRTVLLGAVFVERDDANRVQPGGPITRWHDHSDTTLNPNAANMMHVWLYEGVGDPFGITFRDSRPH